MKILKVIKKPIWLLFLGAFCFVACNDDVEDLTPERNTAIVMQMESGEYSNDFPYKEVLLNYFNLYKGADPQYFFNADYQKEIMDQLPEEVEVVNEVGFHNYVENLVESNVISADSKDMLIATFDLNNQQDPEDIEENDPRLNFTQTFDVPVHSDPNYFLIYSVILEMYNDFYDGATIRDGCTFVEFLNHVITGLAAGIEIGSDIGEVLGAIFGDSGEILGFPIKVVGAAIGGTIGTVVSLFTFSEENCQDCRSVQDITIVSDDNCDFTRTLRAVGAGTDVGAFQWTVIQNGVTASFTTVSPLLGVTQTSSQNPLTVSVLSMCSDPDIDPVTYTETFDLNVVDTSNPLGQVGELTVSVSCPVQQNTGGYEPYNCYMTGEDTGFHFLSSNHGSGNITYSYVVEPSSLADVTVIDDQNIDLYFGIPGEGDLIVTAVNNCTQEEAVVTIGIDVPF